MGTIYRRKNKLWLAYVNAEGKKGSYMSFARVFRREKLPCPRCGTVIIKTRVAGRGTHTCPKCQKI